MTETNVHHDFAGLLRKDQIDHLASEHGVNTHPKITKPHLLDEHTLAHKCMDFAATEPTAEQLEAFLIENDLPQRWYALFTNPNNFVPHTHEVSAPASEATDAEVVAAHEAISKGEKPIAKLSAAERKALTALVDNDFAALTAEMRAFASEVKRSRKDAAKAEFESKKKDADKYRKRVDKASEKFRAALATIKEEAEADGYTVGNMPYNYSGKMNHTSFEVAALSEALSTIDKEVDADLDRALSEVRTAHLAAQRTILLTGVPEGVATQVLNSIPSAKEMMVQAAANKDQPMPPQVEMPNEVYYIQS